MSLWYWIQANSGGLTVVVTFLGVLVAGVYAFLTRRLARTAARQVEETGRQADVTQQMFEASHRPYVEIDIERASYVYRDDHFRLRFNLKNHGQVPATLIAWTASITTLGRARILSDRLPDRGDEAICVFPGRDTLLDHQQGTGPEQAGPEVEIHVTVQYSGRAGSAYHTLAIFA